MHSLLRCHIHSPQLHIYSILQVFGSRVRVDSTAKLAEIESAEKEKMKAKVAKIVGHGISCFINRQLIYNYPEQVSRTMFFLIAQPIMVS